MGVHSSQLDFSQLRPHSKHFQHEGYVHRSVGRLRHGWLRRPSTRVPMSNSSTLTVTTRLLTPTRLPLPSKPSNTPPPPSNTWLPPSKPSNMLLLTPTNTELILTLPLTSTSPTPSDLFLPTVPILMVLIPMVLTHTVTPSPPKRRKKNRCL